MKIINHFKENYIRHGFETLYVIMGILVEDIHELKRNFHQDHFDKFLAVIPQDPWYGGEMIPVDFKQLKFNQQYKYHIRSLHAGQSHYNAINRVLANKVDSLIISNQKEVKRLG